MAAKYKKATPWLKIKAEYLQGATPKELAENYKIKAKTISDKANRENWVSEKAEIIEKTRESIQDKIQTYSNEAIEVLRGVMNGYETENKDKVSAAKAILDLSGLKTSKQEITGANGAPLVEKIRYITPEEQKEVKEHIEKMINGQ